MTAQIFYFAKEKLQRQLLTDGNAAVGVANSGSEDFLLPPHLRATRTMMFHVGAALGIPAPVTFDDTDRVITWTGNFEGKGRYPIRIPYECIAFVRPGPMGGGPNGGRRQTA